MTDGLSMVVVGERERDDDDVAEMVQHGGPLRLFVDVVLEATEVRVRVRP